MEEQNKVTLNGKEYDFLELEDFYFSGFFHILSLDVDFTAVFLFGRRSQCFFQCFDENATIDAFVTADLFNNAFYVCNQHQLSPL